MNKINKFQDIRAKLTDFEHILVSNLIATPSHMKAIIAMVSPDDLQTSHGKAFRVIYGAFFADEDPGIALFRNGISVGEYQSDFLTSTQMVTLVGHIKRYSFAFRFFGLLEESFLNLEAENIDTAYPEFHGKLIKLSQGKDGEAWDVKALMAEFEKEQAEHSERRLAGQQFIGYPSGISDLDNAIDGLRPGHLWILGGYTSSGKTFAALNIVKNVLEQKKRVVMLSLEMSKMQIIGRLVGIIAGVNATEAMKGVMFDEEVEEVSKAKKFLFQSRFAVYNEINYMDRIKATMYEQMYREKVDLFVLDYLQLVTTGKNKTEYETMRDAVKEFQQIGHKLQVPIILLSQISNESAKLPSSTVMGFKGAGDIAAAADLALEFQSDERDVEERNRKIRDGEPVDVKALIKKNRHGKTGVALLTFDGKTGRFSKRKFKPQPHEGARDPRSGD